MRQSIQIPASTANMLVEGYCQDFIQLAASLAQTLEQVSMRDLPLGKSRTSLERVESGMRNLADAIAGMLQTASPAPPARGSGSKGAGIAGAVGQATTPAAAAPPQGGEALRKPIIAGDTSSMPLKSVLQFLSRTRKSGTLSIRLGEQELTFHLTDGCVTDTRSDSEHPSEVVGDLLVELGFAQEDQIRVLTNRHQGSEIELEAAFVQAGTISAAQLRQALEQQAGRRIRRAARAKQATYSFDEGRLAPDDERMQILMRFKGM